MNKKGLAIIIIVNVALVATIVTLYFTLWRPNSSGEIGTLTLMGAIDTDIVLNVTELESLPAIEQEYTLQGNPTIIADYTGVSVYYLLTKLANLTDGTINVKIKAIDNYSYTLTLEDFNETRNIIIAYKRDGKYMKSGSEGGNGPLRLIIPPRFQGEYNGQYCVKFVTAIEILAI